MPCPAVIALQGRLGILLPPRLPTAAISLQHWAVCCVLHPVQRVAKLLPGAFCQVLAARAAP